MLSFHVRQVCILFSTTKGIVFMRASALLDFPGAMFLEGMKYVTGPECTH